MSCPAFNRKKDHFLGYLATFMMQQKFRNDPDPFASFMQAAADLYKNGEPLPIPEDDNTPDSGDSSDSSDNDGNPLLPIAQLPVTSSDDDEIEPHARQPVQPPRKRAR